MYLDLIGVFDVLTCEIYCN